MFERGVAILKREVWDGRVWLQVPVRVVSDDSNVLAVALVDGAPFLFDDEAPPHPWSGRSSWAGPTVLLLWRTGDWYSVWKFFDGDRFDGWYVNFERPLVRTTDGIDTDDLELDLVIDPDGTRMWKDVEQLHARLQSGRLDVDALVHVLEAAAEVSDDLDRDDRWWAPWDDWVPGSESHR